MCSPLCKLLFLLNSLIKFLSVNKFNNSNCISTQAIYIENQLKSFSKTTNVTTKESKSAKAIIYYL